MISAVLIAITVIAAIFAVTTIILYVLLEPDDTHPSGIQPVTPVSTLSVAGVRNPGFLTYFGSDVQSGLFCGSIPTSEKNTLGGDEVHMFTVIADELTYLGGAPGGGGPGTDTSTITMFGQGTSCLHVLRAC